MLFRICSARIWRVLQDVTKWRRRLCSSPVRFSGKVIVSCVGFFWFKAHATNKAWESDFAMIVMVWNGRMTYLRPIFNMEAEAAACQA